MCGYVHVRSHVSPGMNWTLLFSINVLLFISKYSVNLVWYSFNSFRVVNFHGYFNSDAGCGNQMIENVSCSTGTHIPSFSVLFFNTNVTDNLQERVIIQYYF